MRTRIITGSTGVTQQRDTIAVDVLVIGYWNLRFICDLMLVICDFNLVYFAGYWKVLLWS
jgi:hypothetical protein